MGRRCRGETIKDVAEELALDWHTVKALDMQYMEAQLKRVGTPGPRYGRTNRSHAPLPAALDRRQA